MGESSTPPAIGHSSIADESVPHDLDVESGALPKLPLMLPPVGGPSRLWPGPAIIDIDISAECGERSMSNRKPALGVPPKLRKTLERPRG